MRLNKYINEIKITRDFKLGPKPGPKPPLRIRDQYWAKSVKIGNFTYIIDIEMGLIGEWIISFGIKGKSPKISGTGNAIKVFGAVAQAIKEFLKEMDKKGEAVDYLAFTANEDEPSRVKLYDRFAKKFEKMFGFKLEDREVTGYGDIEYEFKRIK